MPLVRRTSRPTNQPQWWSGSSHPRESDLDRTPEQLPSGGCIYASRHSMKWGYDKKRSCQDRHAETAA